jgi:quercetin dioxygenase-like cupin family protein
MDAPVTNMACVGNLWLRQMQFVKAGDCNEGHEHNFDHVTLLAKGSVEVDVEGEKSTFTAPHMILIVAGKRHFLKALEDGTVAYCVHALRDKDTEEILDPAMIPAGVTNAMIAGLAMSL